MPLYRYRKNPFWVTPAGTAGYLSPDEEEGVAGTRFGGHSRYKEKHPTRGPVPAFMTRQVRLEAPRGKPAAGWDIIEREVVNKYNKTETRFLLWFDGQDTGKYALDYNKAVELSHKLQWNAKKGKWCKMSGGRAECNPSEGAPEFRFVRTPNNRYKVYYVGRLVLLGGSGRRAGEPYLVAQTGHETQYGILRFLQSGRLKLAPRSNPVPFGHRSRRNPLISNPVTFRAYYDKRKAKNWDHNRIMEAWKKHKASLKRRATKRKQADPEYQARLARSAKRKDDKARAKLRKAVQSAEIEVYDLADRLLGRSDFFHSAAMLERYPDEGTLRIEMASPKWSSRFAGQESELKQFVKEARKLAERYKKDGVAMTVAVKNPRRRTS